MTDCYTSTKTGSPNGLFSLTLLNSVNSVSYDGTQSSTSAITPVARSPPGNTVNPGSATKCVMSWRKSPSKIIKTSSTGHVSPMRASTLFHNAKLEMATVKIAELRQSKLEFQAIISDLQEENNMVINSANNALADKDKEIKILKSNAWLDELALRQKDDEIAALRQCLVMQNEDSLEENINSLREDTRKLNLAIIDLGRVKKELMEEIHALENQKEELEFT